MGRMNHLNIVTVMAKVIFSTFGDIQFLHNQAQMGSLHHSTRAHIISSNWHSDLIYATGLLCLSTLQYAEP